MRQALNSCFITLDNPLRSLSFNEMLATLLPSCSDETDDEGYGDESGGWLDEETMLSLLLIHERRLEAQSAWHPFFSRVHQVGSQAVRELIW